jgi:leucyl aminopeptidase
MRCNDKFAKRMTYAEHPIEIITRKLEGTFMNIQFSKLGKTETGAFVVGAFSNKEFNIEQLCPDMNALIKKSMDLNEFKAKKFSTLEISGSHKSTLARIIVVGLGEDTALTELDYTECGGTITAALLPKKDQSASIFIETFVGGGHSKSKIAAWLGVGCVLRSYRFDKYRTKDNTPPKLAYITLNLDEVDAAKSEYDKIYPVTCGVYYARDLASEPANILNPETYAERLVELENFGLNINILDEKQMTKLGMHALLGVGRGSDIESRLVVLEWKGGQSSDRPVAFVGKGVTFDTGGISIKPAAGMDDMKWDMAGSATVVGTMISLAKRKAKVNAIGVIALAENMPSGRAQRPGDVVTSMSGQTIEVLNTDAEGRLVLCDALWYCHTNYNPECIIDLATLTGAIIISLGSEYSGIFSNNDGLSKKLVDASNKVGEKLWPLPLHDNYDKSLNCDISDMKNISGDRSAGSIVAAQFLKRFVKDYPWAHLDIAGTAWSKKNMALCPKGATAFGVRLLDRFIADNYEG